MRFRYSPEVDILMVYISDGVYGYGEDNEGVIVHHDKDGNPLSLEILGRQTVRDVRQCQPGDGPGSDQPESG